MRIPGARRYRTAVLLLAGGSALTACGAGTGSTSATIGQVDSHTVGLLSAVGSAVRAQRTSRISLTESFAVNGTSFTVGGTGAYNYRAGQGQLALTTMGKTTTLVITKDAFYAMPPAGAPGSASTPWISIPTSAVLSQQGQSQLSATDPTQSFDEFAALSGVHVVDTEEVRGVQTTHYAGAADPHKSLTTLAPALRSQVETAFKGVTAVPVDIWLDAQGLPRRYRSMFTTTVQGKSLTVATTYELFDFGTPVTVTIPPTSQVTRRTSLTG